MKQILLVEPDKDVAGVLVNALSSPKVQVSWATDAQIAIDLADKNIPDLVIAELAVADQNGLAFLYEFRSYSEWQNVPIVVHSIIPASTLVDEQAWRGLGVEQYLYKPQTSLKKLKKIIAEYL